MQAVRGVSHFSRREDSRGDQIARAAPCAVRGGIIQASTYTTMSEA
jgi:hypothetical protein